MKKYYALIDDGVFAEYNVVIDESEVIMPLIFLSPKEAEMFARVGEEVIEIEIKGNIK